MRSQALDDLTVSAPQLGKTTTAAVWLLARAWQSERIDLPRWWTAPTYSQVNHGMRQIAAMARSAGILRGDPVVNPPEIRLDTGAIIQGRSWEREENLYGPAVLDIVVDEFGQLTDNGYAAISSRRAETVTQGYGHARYIGNVGDVGGAAERIWQMAESGLGGFACRRWTWRDRARAHGCPCGIESIEVERNKEHAPDCPRGIYLTFLANEKTRMAGEQWNALYNAEWVDWSALPVYKFKRAVHVRPLALQRTLPLELSCDFNVDPMCWIVGQSPKDELWALDEIVVEGGATTEECLREFVRRYGDSRMDLVVYGDVSGKARSTKATRTDYAIIEDGMRSAFRQVRMCIPNSNPPVAERVTLFNGMLAPALGESTWFCDPRCSGLATDLARVSWKPGTRDIDKSNKRLTHYSDAEGYRVSWKRRSSAISGGVTVHAPLVSEHVAARW